VTSACANHRTISDTQPGRERPLNRRWGQGQGSGGGVAHVPAALRDTVRGGKNRRRFSINPRGSLSANSHSVFGCAHGASLRKSARSLRLVVRYSPEEGVMDALAPSPLPSPLSDLTRDGVLPQEGGRRPPWRLLPLLLPLAFVSGPSRNPQVDGPRSGRDTVRRKRSAGKIGL
jgi:hypothetical protein